MKEQVQTSQAWRERFSKKQSGVSAASTAAQCPKCGKHHVPGSLVVMNDMAAFAKQLMKSGVVFNK